jgi:hypothetical protein
MAFLQEPLRDRAATAAKTSILLSGNHRLAIGRGQIMVPGSSAEGTDMKEDARR